MAERFRSQQWRPLSEASAHLFASEDLQLVWGLVSIIMLFNWDAYFVPPGSRFLVEISHDGIVWVYCKETADVDSLMSIFAMFKPRLRGPKGWEIQNVQTVQPAAGT